MLGYTAGMHYNKGFATATVLLVSLVVLVLAGAGYAAVRHHASRQPASYLAQDGDGARAEGGDSAARASTTPDASLPVSWRFSSAGERQGMPLTRVTVTVGGTAFEMGTFVGSCAEIGTGGGIDGTGLLVGELSAAQCWFAGSGSEIGVFGHEDGGYEIMVGQLVEREEGAGITRGSFEIKESIPL